MTSTRLARPTRAAAVFWTAWMACAPGLTAQSEGAASPVDAHAAVRRILRWVEAQARPVTTPGNDGGKDSTAILFPPNGGSRVTRDPSIYMGTAGVLVFLENAAAILDDPQARALADRTFAGLLARKRPVDGRGITWSPRRGYGVDSLYAGDAGVGHAFLVRARLRSDDAAMAQAKEVADALIERAETVDVQGHSTLHWGENMVDIIHGSAGIALFLLELGEASGEQKYVDAARAAGHFLASRGIGPADGDEHGKEGARRWLVNLGREQHYVGFSHGTAGISYALARIAAATNDSVCADAARAGAQWLIQHAITEPVGVRWPVVEAGSTRSMDSWCHGAPGTARLFLLLHDLTEEKHYLKFATDAADSLIARMPEPDTIPGRVPGVQPSLCCGVAGAVEFFCDLHSVTKDDRYAEFARQAGRYLRRLADEDDQTGGLRFSNAPAGGGAYPVGLLLGASGEGIAFLRLAALASGQPSVDYLPDRTVDVAGQLPRKR